MGVTVKTSGEPPRWNGAKVAKVIGALVPGMIIRRTGQGIDRNGAPFAPYSQAYREALSRGGESPAIDLRLTGGLMNSIKVRSSVHTDHDATVTIAPDTGTSPAVTLADGRAKRTGRRGPPHNVLADWIEHGTGRAPPRPFMGLTEEQERQLWAAILKSRPFDV